MTGNIVTPYAAYFLEILFCQQPNMLISRLSCFFQMLGVHMLLGYKCQQLLEGFI